MRMYIHIAISIGITDRHYISKLIGRCPINPGVCVVQGKTCKWYKHFSIVIWYKINSYERRCKLFLYKAALRARDLSPLPHLRFLYNMHLVRNNLYESVRWLWFTYFKDVKAKCWKRNFRDRNHRWYESLIEDIKVLNTSAGIIKNWQCIYSPSFKYCFANNICWVVPSNIIAILLWMMVSGFGLIMNSPCWFLRPIQATPVCLLLMIS